MAADRPSPLKQDGRRPTFASQTRWPPTDLCLSNKMAADRPSPLKQDGRRPTFASQTRWPPTDLRLSNKMAADRPLPLKQDGRRPTFASQTRWPPTDLRLDELALRIPLLRVVEWHVGQVHCGNEADDAVGQTKLDSVGEHRLDGSLRGRTNARISDNATRSLVIVIIIIAEMAVFNVAGYLIEGRRRWPVITASPRGRYSTSIQKFERKAHSDEKTSCLVALKTHRG